MQRHPMSERFHQILKEIADLHDKKQLDYGSNEDPFHNMNAAKDWDVEPWVQAMMRADEKMRRLKTLKRKGRLANESAVESFNDIAVLALIGRLLYENKVTPATIGEYYNYFSFSDAPITKAIQEYEINKVAKELSHRGEKAIDQITKLSRRIRGRGNNKAKRKTAGKRTRHHQARAGRLRRTASHKARKRS